jgi:uncharacterized protein YbaP (TraB family)
VPEARLPRARHAHRAGGSLELRLQPLPDVRRPALRLWLGALGLAVTLALSFGAPARAKPPVWTVRTDKATLVLFGSIHLLPAGLDWRPDALNAALAGADELWFELPITPASGNEAAAVSLKRGALPKSQRLSGMMSEDDLGRLFRAAIALHCTPEAIDRMQPWMAELTLSVAADARSGADASSGVEDQIQAQAPATVRRRSFETPIQQIEFLAGAPVKDQLASLNWTVGEIVDDPASYQRTVDQWMAGDLAGLKRDSNDPLQRVAPRLYRRLIAERNHRWADQLAARLRSPGKVVVVVGIGHMTGPDGLPALLRARGLAVEGP